nr:ABC transporter ATP-binding protein/permease [Deltaproteobacteria bacterium]
ALDRWIEARARGLGLTAEPVQLGYDDLPRLLRANTPLVIALDQEIGPPTVVVVVGGAGSSSVLVEAVDGVRTTVTVAQLNRAVRRAAERPFGAELDVIVADASITGRRAQRTRQALLRTIIGSRAVARAWMVRTPARRSWGALVRQARLHVRLPALAIAHAVQSLTLIGLWMLIGRVAVSGRVDPGWAWAGVLLLGGGALLETWTTALVHQWSIRLGALVKQRMLDGILVLEPQAVRKEGVGSLLGRVFEQTALENLVITAAPIGILAIVELMVAMGVLVSSSEGRPAAVVLLAWVLVGVAAGRRYVRGHERWVAMRRTLTHEVIEGVQGHRTRVAQSRPAQWHDREEPMLERYRQESATMDENATFVRGVFPRGWLVLGLCALTPALLQGASVGALAAIVGGVLLAHRALARMSQSLGNLTGAAIAAVGLTPLVRSSSDGSDDTTPEGLTLPEPTRSRGDPLLEVHHLGYRYPRSAQPVFADCNVSLRFGQSVLLEAPSGAGKSTLVSLLCGLAQPDSGMLTLDGIDRGSLGYRAWRRWVVSVPQFHQNHILSGTLAFNVLLGAAWPPSEPQLQRAQQVLEALGLGPLLERMPSGLQQVVGETGWQLSHGERSRIFVARALLQPGALVILDESFGALDPATFLQCLRVVRDTAPTFMLVAHR